MTTDRKAGHTAGPLDGGSAFPNDGAWANGHPEGGMSLRDYFAIHVMSGLYASNSQSLRTTDNDFSADAEVVYRIADAMLRERAKARGE